MKLAVKELKKAIAWIEANTNSEVVHVDMLGAKLFIRTTDKYDKGVEITVYDSEQSKMLPTITSTDRLR